MKYFLCALAVIIEFIVYAMIGGALGWRYGGGLLPQLLLYSAMAATCRAIVKHFNKKNSTKSVPEVSEEDDDEI